jgi:hypothetical protein
MDSDKVSIVRAILNDPHYWVPALFIIFFLLYMFGRFVYLEKSTQTELKPSESNAYLDTIKSTKKMEMPINMEPKKEQTEESEKYDVKSFNQSGGVTAGRIDKIVLAEEEASNINPYENFETEQNGLTFKIRPKIGKWISPFIMIPFSEKDSISFSMDNASNVLFDLRDGVVDTNSDGSQWYGIVCGLYGGVQNPATKDFYYSVTFSSLPSRFIFGDRSNKNHVAFMWVRK